MDVKLLYRIPEVADYLSNSRSKVYELHKSGELRSVHIDRTRLVRARDLHDYVDSLAASSALRAQASLGCDSGFDRPQSCLGDVGWVSGLIGWGVGRRWTMTEAAPRVAVSGLVEASRMVMECSSRMNAVSAIRI